MPYNRRIIAITLLLTSLACSKYSLKDSNSGKTLIEKLYECDLGNIYIGDEEYLESLENVGEKDVIIVDQRKSEDPNMKILDSYKIKSVTEMDCVLQELLKYEEENPTDWDRTYDSMKNEWIIHNISYLLHYDRERTKDVDLNNKDENVYKKVLLKGKDY